MAQIARSLARRMGLDEDLAEALALAHDLGHTPFGHAGQDALHECMKPHGGFEHNLQSLRVVDELEQRYLGFPGLNQRWEVREGLMKHRTPHDHPGKFKGMRFRSPSLEAQVANLADESTYYSHDLGDGLDSGLFSEKQLRKEVKLWRTANNAVEREFGKLPDECRRYFIIRCIIDLQVKDVVGDDRGADSESPASLVLEDAFTYDGGPLFIRDVVRQARKSMRLFCNVCVHSETARG